MTDRDTNPDPSAAVTRSAESSIRLRVRRIGHTAAYVTIAAVISVAVTGLLVGGAYGAADESIDGSEWDPSATIVANHPNDVSAPSGSVVGRFGHGTLDDWSDWQTPPTGSGFLTDYDRDSYWGGGLNDESES